MFGRLVVAVDGTPASDLGLSFTTALARSHHATVHVVHGNTLLITGRGIPSETEESADQIVADAVCHLAEAGIETTGEHVTVTPLHLGSCIARVADQFGADAIVVGSRRRRRLGRLAGQGVRDRITRASALPVLVAPAPLRVGRVRRGPASRDLPLLSPSGPGTGED
jgi:nucleotide-binding universal stress UspA family protein